MERINIDLFDLEICFYVGEAEAKNYIKASKKLGYESYTSGLGEVSGFLIWIRNKLDIKTIVHEISHLVDNIIDYYSLEGSEIRAFLLEFLYETIVNKIKSPQKK